MGKRTLILLLTLALCACASPPKPPSCDGNNKRPVNKDQSASQKLGAAVNPASYLNCA